MAVSLPLCDSEVNMRGWQQGRNGVTMVYESFFLIAMVFESLTPDLKVMLVSPRVIRVVHKGMHLRVYHEVLLFY
jgi:hypothetical protein